MTDLAETEVAAPPDAIEQDVQKLMPLVVWTFEKSPIRLALSRLAEAARRNGLEAYEAMIKEQTKAIGKGGRKVSKADPDEAAELE